MRLFRSIFFPFLILYNSFAYSDEVNIGNDVIGVNHYYTTTKEDTLINIARKFDISFADILSANDVEMDPWIPGENKKLLIPKSHILPFGKRDGIIINIGDLRLYLFKEGKILESYPIGIGRSGWETPMGKSKIIKKKKDPIWIPPESIRKEDPSLPKVVAAGKDNPLGNRALYLSMPSYLIHGTNKPYGVGMKVSHGCIRLYPEDIEILFEHVTEGTKVNIINQRIKAGWKNNKLFIEVHVLPDYVRGSINKEEIKKSDLYPMAYNIVQKAAGLKITLVDWEKVNKAIFLSKGIPTEIMLNK
ncbi:MAG: L,D-transpeptidase family protein [Pelagibacterales bacterium]|nr:L,D-transpeptidase family protein [Pelagibacterales bacterium]